MQHNLATLAQEVATSVDTLRGIAYEHCGIPRETEVALLDLWLYERLAMAAHIAGVHFSAFHDESILSMINFSLVGLTGNFVERCRASLDEVIANPVVRHEITLPEPRRFWTLPGSPSDLNNGAENESWSDFAGLMYVSESWRDSTSSLLSELHKEQEK